MLCFDKDGVLTVYKYEDFTGDNPPYRDISKHTLQELEPDLYGMCLLKHYYDRMPDYTFVLTTLNKPGNDTALVHHQMRDVLAWFEAKAAWFDPTHVLFCTSAGKPTHLNYIKGTPLTKRDLLVDDYYVNLYSWLAAGGTPIKYLNNINSFDPGLKYHIGTPESRKSRGKEDLDLISHILQTL